MAAQYLVRGPSPFTSALNVILGAYYVPNIERVRDESTNQHSGTAPGLVGYCGMLG